MFQLPIGLLKASASANILSILIDVTLPPMFQSVILDFVTSASSPLLNLDAPLNIYINVVTLLTSHGVVPVPKLELNAVAFWNIYAMFTDAVGDVFIIHGN